MKFYGAPNMGVYERKNRKDIGKNKRPKLVFRFDVNGEFVTENAELIKKLSLRFKHDETIVLEKIKTKATDNTEEIKPMHCKKCEFTCENNGQLLAHYRNKHPKGGD